MATREQFQLSTEERKKRTFSEEFKRQKVKEIERKQTSVLEVSKAYQVQANNVYEWIKKYTIKDKNGVSSVVEMESETKRVLALLQKVAELERIVGQKQIMKEIKKKVGNMEIGNYGVKMSNGFVKETGTPYRMGALYVGIGETKIGIDSDRYERHPIQDILAHHILSPQPGFKTLSKSVKPFYQTNTQNLFKPLTTPRFTLYD